MEQNLKKCLKLILDSEPIIIPTDTVYGLVCRYNSKSAVEKIYKLKKRSRNKPLILLGHDWKSLKRFVVGVRHGMPLLKQWPGPLTIVLPVSKHVPKFLNKGFKTIGIRVPKNKFLLKLLKQCPNHVLASTSANVSGKKDVNQIAKKVKLFVKAKKGEMSYRPSKIIEITKDGIKVLR
ncbi:MAG: threonylcarbamoyl-AMP synthase [Candidatus Melainabacteria bacterium RIFCSPHIGHO2_02_FULL_34_12]|nr:MAG: threonylcarbamoyl-AMP synthase [Candidatus Melainabacteria bacterium RIFCSPHIGHO2_02_FULL_34_12]